MPTLLAEMHQKMKQPQIKLNGLNLHYGDIFCTKNPENLGKMICAVEKFWDIDNKAEYSHSGIIVDPGTFRTFEARWKIGYYDLADFKGEKILIGRHVAMTPFLHHKAIQKIDRRAGKNYPLHRLIFHLFPPLAKYINFDHGVCSEVTAEYLCAIKFLSTWKGRNPAHIENMIRYYKDWSTVYEGYTV
jgi:hypothetical protein